ncbi:MAG: ABC transporter permease, partial [Terriglobales bacterium]
MDGGTHKPALNPLLWAVSCVVLFYLVAPVLIVVPLSFSSGLYLSFPPPGFSLQWYRHFFTDPGWTGSAWLSIWVGLTVMALAVLLGTPAAFALVRGRLRGARLINGFVLTPVI